MTRHAGPGGNYGEFIAWDAATGRKVRGIKEKFLVYSGVLATGSDLAFYGTVDGWFRAVNARTGKVLWSQKLGSGIIGSPMTYRAPDGHQYIAVYSGVGGASMVTQAMPGFPPRVVRSTSSHWNQSFGMVPVCSQRVLATTPRNRPEEGNDA